MIWAIGAAATQTGGLVEMPGHADKKPKRWECGEERVVVGATCRMRLQRSARTNRGSAGIFERARTVDN